MDILPVLSPNCFPGTEARHQRLIPSLTDPNPCAGSGVQPLQLVPSRTGSAQWDLE